MDLDAITNAAWTVNACNLPFSYYNDSTSFFVHAVSPIKPRRSALCPLYRIVGQCQREAAGANIVLPHLPGKLLKNKGRWIVDDNGRVYVFHGVNMVSKLPPYTLSAAGFKENSADLLAQNGINLVRVGVIFSAVEPAPWVFDDKYLTDIRQTVDMLAAKGIMSLIDFHQDGWGPSFVCAGFPEWATITGSNPIRPIDNFPKLYFSSKALQTAFDKFWANAPGPDGRGLQDHYAQA